MTGFTLIYDENHEYNEGVIEIANSTSHLTMAYLVTSSSVSNALSAPILRGFLYQVDVNEKRSRPYPIISDRQTIRLDMSECEKFLFVPSNRIINQYSIALYVSTGLGGGETVVDLSAYALKSELPVLDNYVNEAELATALSDYALVFQIPDVSSYVTSSSLATALTDYVLTADLPNSSGSSQNFIALSTNTTLESNKNYQATVPDLVFTLPLTPSIGDVIDLATGNFSLQVNHGDASHQVLNNNTYTVAGINNGIMLKPYSAIRLRYCELNLWVSSFRSRTINNFIPLSTEPTSTLKTYTASSSLPSAYGAALPGINNGIKTTGALANGFLSDSTSGGILLTLASPIILDTLKLWNGQGNVGASPSSYTVNSITVYAGNSASGENLGTYTFTNSTAVEQSKSINPNSVASNQFFLSINPVTPEIIGIIELEIWGKGATGGEVVV